jgi:hypothetical protein
MSTLAKRAPKPWTAPKPTAPAKWARISKTDAKLLTDRKCMADTGRLLAGGSFAKCGKPREAWWTFEGKEIALCEACRKVLVSALPAEKKRAVADFAAKQVGLFAPEHVAPIAVTPKAREKLFKAQVREGKEKQRAANAEKKQRKAGAA